MRPGPVGWAMVLFLGAIAATDGGEAATGQDAGAVVAANAEPEGKAARSRPREPGVVATPVGPPGTAEARARWVLDRIEEEVAVIVGDGGTRTVPRRDLGEGAREGDLLDERLAPDPAATARARAEVTRLRRRLAGDAAPLRRTGGEDAPEGEGEAPGAPAPPAGPVGPRTSR